MIFKKTPSIFSVQTVLDSRNHQAHINDKWVCARPVAFYSWKHRLRATWLVLSGQADVLKWPEGQ